VTPGKLYAGTRVIAPDGSVPGWWRSTLRALVGSLAELVANLLVLGILDPAWLLWDPRRQTLHDKAAGTLVIRAKARRPLPAFVVSLLLALAVQVGLVFAVIRPLIVQAYYVPSGSMLPTLRKHDRLLVNKLSYRYGRLQRGDVIVFVAPKAALLSNPEANPDPNEKKDFIKRLIALPGDTVKVEDGRLWLREKGQSQLHTVEEPYVAAAPIYAFGPVTVPEGHVLVFGDNRNNSNDSTKWLLPTGGGTEPAPFLPIANIRGRAFFRYWPLTSFGDLPSADNFDSR
jgi:signal peptidase I